MNRGVVSPRLAAKLVFQATIVIAAGLVYGNDSPDVRYGSRLNYKIKETKEGYKAECKAEVWQVCLSERSTLDAEFIVGEHLVSEVSGVKAYLNGEEIDKYRIEQGFNTDAYLFYSEARVWLIDYGSLLHPGDSIHYKYNRKVDEIGYITPFYIPNLDRVTEYRVAFEHPADITVDFEFFFSRDSVPCYVSRPDQETTVLQVRDIAGEDDLPMFPFNSISMGILPRFHKADRVLNPVTAEKLTAWYWNHVDDDPPLNMNLDPEIQRILSEPVDDVVKLRELNDHIRSTFRYIKVGQRGHGYFPLDPMQVLNDHFGDCKDRAHLLRTIARSAGITVDMAVVNVGPSPEFEGTHFTLYNHAVCTYRDGDYVLFFDPTAKYDPFGVLPEPTVGTRAVILNREHPVYAVVPRSSPDPDMVFEITGALADLSHCRATVVVRGDHHGTITEIIAENDGSKQANLLQAYFVKELFKIGLTSPEVVESAYDSTILQAVADLSTFVVSSSRRTYVPKVPFVAESREIMRRADDPFPIYVGDRAAERMTITLAVDGIETAPDSLCLGNSGLAEFRAVATMKGDSVCFDFTYDRQIKVFRDSIKSDYLDFCNRLMAANTNMFILEEEVR